MRAPWRACIFLTASFSKSTGQLHHLSMVQPGDLNEYQLKEYQLATSPFWLVSRIGAGCYPLAASKSEFKRSLRFESRQYRQ
ncbi:MAG: hypothetical protein CMM01_26475 [Rhodopirellula sp.]|nr:hypothetical protein [Rhodopirellula sp.]